MKELFAGILLIIVLGLGGLVYRNAMEQPYKQQAGVGVCDADARICPDGTSVGRTGPECSFAFCAFPNITIMEGVAALAPAGYTESDWGHPQGPNNILNKPGLSESVPHTISIYILPIPEGQTGDQVILANTRYQPADMQAEDLSRFKNVTIAGRAYRTVVIERFEALVESSYFLVREKDVLRFDIVEHDVTNWTEPDLVVEDLPEHQALRRLLETLQVQ